MIQDTTSIFNATSTGQRLISDMISGNLSHAYLIIGPEGAGKKTLTRAFAKLLMCLDPHGTVPCNECSCCKYFEAFGEHPNVTMLSTGNKASIGVSEIRDMSEGVFVEPYIGNKKIYIINEADKMTQQAQNALLKILEEPPQYAVFFLLSANRYSILQTVISRCRTLNMSLYSQSALKSIIAEKAPEFTPNDVDVLIHRSQGLPGRLIGMLDSTDEQRMYVFDTVNALIENDIEKIFAFAQKLESREEAIAFVTSINEIMRDITVYTVSGDKNAIFNSDKADFIMNIAQRTTLKKQTAFLDESVKTLKMLSGNVSFQLCVKNLLMKW